MTTAHPTPKTPNFEFWQIYVEVINRPIRTIRKSIKFNAWTAEDKAVLDLDPFFIIVGSNAAEMRSELINLFVLSEDQVRGMGELVFESIVINGRAVIVINRHLLLDAILETRTLPTRLSDMFVPQATRFFLNWFGRIFEKKTQAEADRILNEAVRQFCEIIEEEIDI